MRGALKLGRRLLSLDWRLYAAAGRALVSALARRVGVRAGWATDRPNPYSVAIPWTARDCAYVRRHGQGNAAVIADYIYQVEAFDCVSAPVATATVMHDLFHARADSGSGAIGDSVAPIERDAEIARLGRADVVIAIQAREAAFVAEHQPDVRVIVAPMAARCVDAASRGDDHEILFVGSNTAPNVVGLRWFFDEVWPLIRASDDRARLTVVGTVNRAFRGAPAPGVHFLGLVGDLSSLYARAGVVISPLTFGSGLKIKLVEALAHGKAIVATSVTLQGVDGADQALIRADDAASFAAAAAALACDRARRAELAQAALEHARDHFSFEACYAPFIAWLRDVMRQQEAQGGA